MAESKLKKRIKPQSLKPVARKRYQITIDKKTECGLRVLGAGSLSTGIRQAWNLLAEKLIKIKARNKK